MRFTTKELVRAESGFTGNADILDSTIIGYITQANGYLLSYIATVYDASKLDGSLFTGSQAAGFLQNLETSLAAGFLLINEYGPESRGTDKDGYQRKKDVLDTLQKVIEGELRLFDINFNEFAKKTTASAGGIVMSTPDDNSNLDPIFTTSQKF